MPASITEIDKNLAVETVCNQPVCFHNVRSAPFAIYGLCDPHDGKPFHRIPADVAGATNEGVGFLYLHTSGGRVRFKTTARYMALKAVISGVGMMPHMTLVGTAGMDVYLKVGNEYHYHASCMTEGGNDAAIRMTENQGYTNMVWLPEGMKDITINLPLYGGINELLVGLDPDAVIEASDTYRDIPPVIYYGSSITQGGCASRPGNNYPNILSRKFNVDFRNLGFSGSARGEQAISDYIAAQPMSAFVFAYDHNAPTVEHLAATHETMYLNIRATHPGTPVIFITRPGIRYNAEERARREVVKTTYNNAKSRGENVYVVDGEQIFAIFGGDGGSVDGCHPNDLGFACVAVALDPIFEDIFGR
ncbi:MAG: hypothetical protein IJW00_08510 [Clostridia bacterium]|nr:hypothetical protein [Clostridia bacterium]